MDDPGPEAFLSTFESNSSYSAVRHTVILNIFCIVSRIEEIIWDENDSYKLWRPVMALNILSKNLCLKYIPQASTSKLLRYRLFFLRLIVQFFTQIYMNYFVSS